MKLGIVLVLALALTGCGAYVNPAAPSNLTAVQLGKQHPTLSGSSGSTSNSGSSSSGSSSSASGGSSSSSGSSGSSSASGGSTSGSSSSSSGSSSSGSSSGSSSASGGSSSGSSSSSGGSSSGSPSPTPQTYDMLAWMTMDTSLSASHHLTGNHNPIYTDVLPDRFFWTKTGQGFPWDIQLYDNNYIYLWVTESNWQDPNTYKVFHDPVLGDYNLPLVPRFAQAGYPGSKITIPASDTTYETHTDCNTFTSQKLGGVVNTVWGPYSESLGGDLPDNLTTLVISYQYSCDSSLQNCKDKEEFHVAQPYGLVKWQHQRLQSDGTYAAPDNVTYLNRVATGQVKPYTTCF